MTFAVASAGEGVGFWVVANLFFIGVKVNNPAHAHSDIREMAYSGGKVSGMDIGSQLLLVATDAVEEIAMMSA
jgi:hypothetical protein